MKLLRSVKVPASRILFVGWGRAGKDTCAEFLGRMTNLGYGGSTSWAGKEDVARVLGIHPQIAWETRHARREEWKAILDKLREGDQAILMARSLSTGGVIAGTRDKCELEAARARGLLDAIIWVHRDGVPRDPTVTFEESDCDAVLYNNGTLDQLYSELIVVADRLEIPLRGFMPPRAPKLAGVVVVQDCDGNWYDPETGMSV